MQLIVRVPRGLWFTVGLALALSGCKSEQVSESPWPGDSSMSQAGAGADLKSTTQHALRSLLEQTGADPQSAAPVKLAQFTRSSEDGNSPPTPPSTSKRRGAAEPVPPGSIGDALSPPPLPDLPGPRRIDEVVGSSADAPRQPENRVEIDLSTALGMVSGRNPQIALAAQRYNEAYARLEAARVLWLPSLRAGISYNKHDGRLQQTEGTVVDSSRGALDAGVGVQASGTGSPAVAGVAARFHLADAVFQPRIANRAAAARQEAARATTDDVLLEAAVAYLGLLKADEDESIAKETLDNTQKLADLTATFARTGQGPQADADRASAELALRRNDVPRAEEEVQVASARLIELLHMDPGLSLSPQEPAVVPIDLVARQTPVGDLLATGLSNRPELAESRHLVGEAVYRYRREKYSSLLPSAYLGASYGAFGGGRGSNVEDFGDRFDLDAVAYWELRNFGFGDRAARDEARYKYQQARLRNIQVMDQVAREIIEAHAQVVARYKQIAVAESGIAAATDSYKRNMERIRAGEGLPIEVLQAIQALDQARRDYLRSVISYNEAQFRLHRALGWPIQ